MQICLFPLVSKLGQTKAQFCHHFVLLHMEMGELCLLYSFVYLWANLSCGKKGPSSGFPSYFLSLSPNCPTNPVQTDIMPLQLPA